MAEKLAKLADVKAALGFAGDDYDTELTGLLIKATAVAEGAACAGRPLMRRVDLAEFPNHWDRSSYRLYLQRFPVESVASVVQLYRAGSDADFDEVVESGADLIAPDEYVLHAKRGILQRIYGVWSFGPRWIRVVYTGGYIDPDTEEMPPSAIEPPQDLQRAIVAQATAWWNTQKHAGLKNQGGGSNQSGINFAEYPGGVHPELITATQGLRRIVI